MGIQPREMEPGRWLRRRRGHLRNFHCCGRWWTGLRAQEGPRKCCLCAAEASARRELFIIAKSYSRLCAMTSLRWFGALWRSWCRAAVRFCGYLSPTKISRISVGAFTANVHKNARQIDTTSATGHQSASKLVVAHSQILGARAPADPVPLRARWKQ